MEIMSVGFYQTIAPPLHHPKTASIEVTSSPLTRNNGHYAHASRLRFSQNYQRTH